MSPRNLDDTNCKEKSFSEESQDSQQVDFRPIILHKKHKVIKLVKAQLLDLQEQGLLSSLNSSTADDVTLRRGKFDTEAIDSLEKYQQEPRSPRAGSIELMESEQNGKFPFLWPILFVLLTFLLFFAAAWLSAGPLSNRTLHTPIPWASLVRTDSICELERKCMLRWSTSNYLD